MIQQLCDERQNLAIQIRLWESLAEDTPSCMENVTCKYFQKILLNHYLLGINLINLQLINLQHVFDNNRELIVLSALYCNSLS